MEEGWSVLPEGVDAVAALAVVAASFFTSALTASFGLGGGLALLALMGALFPPAAIIPVHGVAQLGSNAGRLYLQRGDVVLRIALWFGLGCLLGSIVGARLYLEAPEQILRGAVGAFVLLAVWGPKPKGFAPSAATFFATGGAGSVLSMFFGATGPITAAMLSVAGLGRLATVATHAACMVIQHLLKTLAFGIIGFAFADWAPLIAAIIVAGFFGSMFGTRALRGMPEAKFRSGFKIVLTFFGCYLLAAAMINAR